MAGIQNFNLSIIYALISKANFIETRITTIVYLTTMPILLKTRAVLYNQSVRDKKGILKNSVIYTHQCALLKTVF